MFFFPHIPHHIFHSFFFFNDTATTEIYTLSLHDALPIFPRWPKYVLVAPRPKQKCDCGLLPQIRSDLLAPTLSDRKSTRLNSSHGYISYAVFCLKKKKNKHTHISCRASTCSHTREYCARS